MAGRPLTGGRAGFTLLEVLAALAVVSVVLTALFSLQRQSASLAERMEFYALAPALAQRVLAERELKGADGLSDQSGDCGADFPGYRYRFEVRDFASELSGLELEDLKRIEVAVTREDAGLVYTLRTHRLQEG
jgi:type II secretion system protein I